MKRGLMSGVAAIAVVAAAGASAPAAAQQAFNWTGFYLGAHAGYGDASYDGGIELDSFGDEITFAEDLDLNGVAAGFQGGFNYQFDQSVAGVGNIVVGAEADVTFVDWDDGILGGGSDSKSIGGAVDLLWSVRARLGIAMDRTLVYATGGFAFSDAEVQAAGTSGSADLDFNDVGGVVGGGIEYAATDMISIRAEGLYYIFDDRFETAKFDITGDSGDDDFLEFDDAWVFRVGANILINSVL